MGPWTPTPVVRCGERQRVGQRQGSGPVGKSDARRSTNPTPSTSATTASSTLGSTLGASATTGAHTVVGPAGPRLVSGAATTGTTGTGATSTGAATTGGSIWRSR